MWIMYCTCIRQDHLGRRRRRRHGLKRCDMIGRLHRLSIISVAAIMSTPKEFLHKRCTTGTMASFPSLTGVAASTDSCRLCLIDQYRIPSSRQVSRRNVFHAYIMYPFESDLPLLTLVKAASNLTAQNIESPFKLKQLSKQIRIALTDPQLLQRVDTTQPSNQIVKFPRKQIILSI